MEGTETRGRWLQRATVYAVSMTAAGALTGTVFAAAGAGVDALWAGGTLPLAAVLAAVAVVYAAHELGFVRLPVPGRQWQVPAEWVRGGFYRSAAVFGATVGFGVFTRVPYASLPVLLAWLVVAGNPLYGAAAGTVYGATRAASIYMSNSCKTPEDMVSLNQRLMAAAPSLHEVTGAALAAFATYLLAAPLL